MPDVVNTTHGTIREPTVDFSWSPQGAPYSITIGTETYPPSGATRYQTYRTAVNQLLTFTAEVDADSEYHIQEYFWDFGDGFYAYGPVATHSYSIPSRVLSVLLRVTDSLGRVSYVRKTLLLEVMYASVTRPRVVGTGFSNAAPGAVSLTKALALIRPVIAIVRKRLNKNVPTATATASVSISKTYLAAGALMTSTTLLTSPSLQTRASGTPIVTTKMNTITDAPLTDLLLIGDTNTNPTSTPVSGSPSYTATTTTSAVKL
jgi:hypothetical protein